MGLWVSLKRDRIYAEIYYKGEKIMTLKVNDHNRGNNSVIDLGDNKDVQFKLIKQTVEIPDSEEFFNKEEFNK